MDTVVVDSDALIPTSPVLAPAMDADGVTVWMIVGIDSSSAGVADIAGVGATDGARQQMRELRGK